MENTEKILTKETHKFFNDMQEVKGKEDSFRLTMKEIVRLKGDEREKAMEVFYGGKEALAEHRKEVARDLVSTKEVNASHDVQAVMDVFGDRLNVAVFSHEDRDEFTFSYGYQAIEKIYSDQWESEGQGESEKLLTALGLFCQSMLEQYHRLLFETQPE